MRILIIRLSSIGDIILTEPIAAALRKTYPDAGIDFLTYPQYEMLPKMFPDIDHVYTWHKDKKSLDLLKSTKYDLVIDLHGKLQTFLIRQWLDAPKNVTYRKKHWLRRLIVLHLTKQKIHSTSDLYASVLEQLQIPFSLSKPVIKLPPLPNMNALAAIRIMKESHQILIGVFPGATHPTKMYPIDRMKEVLAGIPEALDPCFVLLGGEKEKEFCETLKAGLKWQSIDLSDQLDFSSLAHIVNEMDIVISMDSGPMHLAAALEKPQVAIFGATHTKLGFAPQNPKALVLEKNYPCQPCSLHGGEKCPKGHFRCMKDITPQEVVSAVVELYEK